jgi:hypothetical protein
MRKQNAGRRGKSEGGRLEAFDAQLGDVRNHPLVGKCKEDHRVSKGCGLAKRRIWIIAGTKCRSQRADRTAAPEVAFESEAVFGTIFSGESSQITGGPTPESINRLVGITDHRDPETVVPKPREYFKIEWITVLGFVHNDLMKPAGKSAA